MKMILMHGVSGTGKSHRAKSLCTSDGIIISSDSYFGTGEEYRKNWDVSLPSDSELTPEEVAAAHLDRIGKKLHAAHNMSQRNAETACRNKVPLIIIDNTNLSARDMKPYIELSEKYGYEIAHAESNSPWWLEYKNTNDEEALIQECLKRNEHGVPETTLRKQLSRYKNVKDTYTSL